MKQQLINFYLDYVNNYITIEAIAKSYGLPTNIAEQMIEAGKWCNEHGSIWK